MCWWMLCEEATIQEKKICSNVNNIHTFWSSPTYLLVFQPRKKYGGTIFSKNYLHKNGLWTYVKYVFHCNNLWFKKKNYKLPTVCLFRLKLFVYLQIKIFVHQKPLIKLYWVEAYRQSPLLYKIKQPRNGSNHQPTSQQSICVFSNIQIWQTETRIHIKLEKRYIYTIKNVFVKRTYVYSQEDRNK